MDFNNSVSKSQQRGGVIYVITNNLNGKQYVGQTVDFKSRIRHHKRCKNSTIGRAIQKYGWENFSVEVLEECESREKLNERKIFWIAKLNCMKPNGYNLTSGGETNKKVADEVRKKLSDYNKARGIKPPPRTGKEPWNKGKKWSDETRKKLSESHLGQPAYWKGKHLPGEVRAKISATLKALTAKMKLEENKFIEGSLFDD